VVACHPTHATASAGPEACLNATSEASEVSFRAGRKPEHRRAASRSEAEHREPRQRTVLGPRANTSKHAPHPFQTNGNFNCFQNPPGT
jgi:hypothetical protein